VSSLGQITLPAGMRRHLGITPGAAVIVEEREGELLLRPAAVFELELYGDAQIEAWDRADTLTSNELNAILKRLQQA
jgi:AbrB family looped-hinge helix DNA binding protein